MQLIKVILCSLALIGTKWVSAQQLDMEHMVFQVGAVYYFGYGGVDLSQLRAQMPLHVADSFSYATFDGGKVTAEVTAVTGKPPTDINPVCCDKERHVIFYIGIAGTTSRPLPVNAVPTGEDHLPPEAVELYDADMAALGPATAAGRSGEDDSQGYMLANDPAAHAINLKMRVYAVGREAEITRVLEHASDGKQRQVAAALLGYAKRSSTQILALERAILDADGETRNNAVRALIVLASAQDAAPLEVDPKPLIALLYSGEWTDRNKASFLLSRITGKDNPLLLKALRHEALPALAEGASWDDGHSWPFVVVLGRALGVTPEKAKKMLATGKCCSDQK